MDIENQDDIGKTTLFKDLDDEKYSLFLQLLSFENSEFLDVIDKMTDRKIKRFIVPIIDGTKVYHGRGRFPMFRRMAGFLRQIDSPSFSCQ